MRKKDVEEYLLSNNFTKDNLNNLTNSLNVTEEQIINELSVIICGWKHLEKQSKFILSYSRLVCFISENSNFKNEQIDVFRENIDALTHKIAERLKKVNDNDLSEALSILTKDVIFIKKQSLKNLECVIVELINKKENINIIKSIINLDIMCIYYNNSYLFDYTFSLLIDSIIHNKIDTIYYSKLLRIFYNKKIKVSYYLEKLNIIKYSNYYNELYNLITNSSVYLEEDYIFDKFHKNIEVKPYELNSFSKLINNDRKNIFTIDKNSTFTRDDALSIIRDGNNFIVQVYISDIVPYINYNSNNDLVAKTIYKNSYLYGKNNITIFHNDIVKELSLNKGHEKCVITLNIVFNKDFKVIDYFFKPQVIKVNANLNYENIEHILNNKANDELSKDIENLYRISSILKYLNKGKEDYYRVKSKNRTLSSNEDMNSRSHQIVEEFSVLYNSLVGDLSFNNDIPCIYRRQDKSNIYDLFVNNNVHLDKWNRMIIDKLYLYPYFSLEPGKHEALNKSYYSQSTNPLRKYSDGYEQRLLHKYYFKDISFDDSNIEEIVEYFNQKQIETELFNKEYNKTLLLKK